MNKCKSLLVLAVCLAGASTSLLAAEAGERSEASRAELQRKLDEAQERLNVAAREVAELSMSLSDGVMGPRLSRIGPNRAMLGIALSPNRGQRADGVEVASVSPGGAAAEAGLKAGDVLLEIDGTKLTRDGERTAEDKLLGFMQSVQPNQKVRVRYRRDGKVHDAEITARPLRDQIFTMALPPALPGFPAQAAFFRADGVFGSTELVAMTPKLGQYFGTDKGLLVVRAPEDARLKLEEGDVILDIDGRTPSSASHAFRILSSYQEGEKLDLTVMRNKKKLTFSITVPEGPRFEHRIERGFGPTMRVRPEAGAGVGVEHAAPPVPLPPRAVIRSTDETV